MKIPFFALLLFGAAATPPPCGVEQLVYINCDFDVLKAGVALQDQADALHDDCGLRVSSSVSSSSFANNDEDDDDYYYLTLLDSSNITADDDNDPDLGSPNALCDDSFTTGGGGGGLGAVGGGGGGRGLGGAPFLPDGVTPNPFANCGTLYVVLFSLWERFFFLNSQKHAHISHYFLVFQLLLEPLGKLLVMMQNHNDDKDKKKKKANMRGQVLKKGSSVASANATAAASGAACMRFTFDDPVHVLDIGILDAHDWRGNDEKAKITVSSSFFFKAQQEDNLKMFFFFMHSASHN